MRPERPRSEYVLENLDKLVVKPAFRTHVRCSIRKTTRWKRTRTLKRRIEFDPDLFVAQERVEFSTAPCVGRKGRSCRDRSALRVFLVANGGTAIA